MQQASKSAQGGLGRWLKLMVGGFVVLVGLVLLGGQIAKAVMVASYPPPGELVDVGGYALHVWCEGSGTPTVIMEAGLGTSSLTWARVQPELATATRVCVYDRAGLGWSAVSPRPRVSAEMVDELHSLLSKAQIAPPYVFVGHSMGGLMALHYAHLYPQEVVGLVLVDAQHPDWAVRKVAALESVEAQMLADAEGQVGVIKVLTSLGILALSPSITGSDPRLPAEALARDQALNATRATIAETSIAESAANAQSLQQVYDLGITSVGEIPLAVLASGKRSTVPGVSEALLAEIETIGKELQAKFATLSPNSEFVMVTESGHFIQLDDPEAVITATQWVLARVKK